MGAFGFIEKIESNKAGFFLWIALFFAITFSRALFEGLLEITKTLAGFDSVFIHFQLFWVTALLSFAIVLRIITKENIVKITKIVIPCFAVILITPIVDVIVSGGLGFQQSYIAWNVEQIFDRLVYFYGEFSGTGVTPGQRVAIITALVLVGVYAWAKTKSAFKTILAPVAMYVILFLYAISLGLLNAFFYGLLGWETRGAAATFVSLKQMLNIVYIALIVLQMVAWLWFWNRKKLVALVKNSLPLCTVHYALLMPLFGAGIFYYLTPPGTVNWVYLALAIASAFFAWQAGIAFNGAAQKTEQKNKDAPSQREYLKIGFVESLLALMLALLVGYNVSIVILCSLLLVFVYSMPPLKLRNIPILSTFTLAVFSLILIVAGFFAAGAINVRLIPMGFAIFPLVFVTLAFNAKDLKNIKADKKAGIKTLPTILGEANARRIIALLIAASYMLAPVYLGLPFALFIPLSIVFAVVNWALIVRTKSSERILMLLYFFYAALVAVQFLA